MEYGPVDLVVVAFGEPKFEGVMLGEIERLVKDGTIRVLDAMLLVKGEDGEVKGIDIEDLSDKQKSALGFIETGTRGLFDSEDSDMLQEGMVSGSAVVALAIEHTWAKGLAGALDDAGGVMAMNMRIPAPVVDDALSALGA